MSVGPKQFASRVRKGAARLLCGGVATAVRAGLALEVGLALGLLSPSPVQADRASTRQTIADTRDASSPLTPPKVVTLVRLAAFWTSGSP